MNFTKASTFLPLETGVVPFSLKREAVMPIAYEIRRGNTVCDEVNEEPNVRVTPRLRSVFAGHANRLSTFARAKLLRRRNAMSTLEPVWYTSEDNWRPGLLTLEQAARRDDIVHRAEAFERH